MEAKYKKFLEYDWVNSNQWHFYIENDVYPSPPLKKIDTFKKKFYKAKIDQEFDVNYQSPSENSASSSQNQNQNNNSSRTQNPYTNPPPGISGSLFPILQKAEIFLWGFFSISFIIGFSPLLVSALALLVRVIRRLGIPKFTMEFAQHLFLDEHFQIMLYNLLFMIDRLNIFVLIPLFITCLMNVSEYFKLNGITLLSKFTDLIYNRRVEIVKLRSNVEVGIGFLLVPGIFFGLNSVLLPLFYWQFLRFKYIVNEDTKVTFAKMNSYVNNFKNKPSTPSFLRYAIEKAQALASYLGRTEPAPGQPAGGQNCNIF
jgi:hypothetical protein